MSLSANMEATLFSSNNAAVIRALGNIGGGFMRTYTLPGAQRISKTIVGILSIVGYFRYSFHQFKMIL